MNDEHPLSERDLLDRPLREIFGHERFLPGQREVVEHLMAGRSAVAIFPTGGGKSICYQLPAILLPGLTLVVSPLLALMKDQIDSLAARRVPAARLDSTLDADRYEQVFQQLREGTVKLLYVSPERFQNERFREFLGQLSISLMAVDEVHCISEWGHNFRPDYLKLAGIAKSYGVERVLGLTATATPEVADDIRQQFAIPAECAVRTGFYRSNLQLHFTPVTAAERDSLLVERLRERPPGAAIVYVTLQKSAERVAQYLTRQGFQAKGYHAGMRAEDREAIQNWFIGSDTGIVVATIAFGMGIDKADIRYVYHYNLAKSLENYSQEIGRAGRDGNPSVGELLFCPEDLGPLENFVYGDTPDRDSIARLVRHVLDRGDSFDVSFYDLANEHDMRQLVVRTLLTYLELRGILEGGTPFYREYRFLPRLSSADILSRFEGERREFLADMFRQARRVEKWIRLDVDAAAERMKTTRQRLVRALDYLAERQWLEVQTAGIRNRYRRLSMPDDVEQLSAELHEVMRERETRDIRRMRQVEELVYHSGCQTRVLAEYFGESLDERLGVATGCGHCSFCLSGCAPARVAGSPAEAPPDLWTKLEPLCRKHSKLFDRPRVLAKFLCGIRTPSLSRARLGSDPLFGILERVPFRDVLELCRQRGR